MQKDELNKTNHAPCPVASALSSAALRAWQESRRKAVGETGWPSQLAGTSKDLHSLRRAPGAWAIHLQGEGEENASPRGSLRTSLGTGMHLLDPWDKQLHLSVPQFAHL